MAASRRAPRRRALTVAALAALAALAVPALAACGPKPSGAGGGGIAVDATDTACTVATTTLPAGPVTLRITNKGNKTTEVYLFAADAGAFTKVVTEVENIGPATSRDLTATLTDPAYEVVCKPGMTGDGIHTRLTITGAGTGSPSPSASAAPDRTFTLTTDGTAIAGAPASATTGETLGFTLANNASGARALELKDPSGAVAGVSSEIASGKTGTLVVTVTKAGTWDINVEGDGVEDITVHLTVR